MLTELGDARGGEKWRRNESSAVDVLSGRRLWDVCGGGLQGLVPGVARHRRGCGTHGWVEVMPGVDECAGALMVEGDLKCF